MNACLFGHDHVATYLLDKGANIEAKKPIDMNALLLACQSGHCFTAKLLLDRGANIAAIGTIVGTRILLKVAESGNDLLLKLLLERGADANALHCVYGTSLHSACAYGRTKCVQVYGHNSIIDLLMKHKKDPRTILKRDPMTENQNSNLANGKKLKYEVIEHDSNEPPSLEQKLSSKMQEMERKFEKKLAELREHYERKEKDMIKSLKRVTSELARSNEKEPTHTPEEKSLDDIPPEVIIID
jgi:ankyrin repeat protein